MAEGLLKECESIQVKLARSSPTAPARKICQRASSKRGKECVEITEKEGSGCVRGVAVGYRLRTVSVSSISPLCTKS